HRPGLYTTLYNPFPSIPRPIDPTQTVDIVLIPGVWKGVWCQCGIAIEYFQDNQSAITWASAQNGWHSPGRVIKEWAPSLDEVNY
ncbi:MAG: hypothetical protein WC797_01260, partial [Candidatus Paceibacterota bacterium]